jgi:hypothetical protein
MCYTCPQRGCIHFKNVEAICASQVHFKELVETNCKQLRESAARETESFDVLGLSHDPIVRYSMAGIGEEFSPETLQVFENRQFKGRESIPTNPLPYIPQGSTCMCPLMAEFGVCWCNNTSNGCCGCGMEWSKANVVSDRTVTML